MTLHIISDLQGTHHTLATGLGNSLNKYRVYQVPGGGRVTSPGVAHCSNEDIQMIV